MLPDALEKWNKTAEEAKAEDDSEEEKSHQDTTSPAPAKEY